MLTHRWISFTLFLVLIVTIFAQDPGGKLPRPILQNNDDDDFDDDRAPVKPPLNVAEVPTPPARSPEKTNPPLNVDKRRSSPTPLAASSECKADVQKYCNKGGEKLLPNLKVLQCVDDLDNAVNLIGPECQNLIYKFKHNMTHDVRFDDAAQRQCAKDIALLDECNDHIDERGSGRLISCLYEKLPNITESSCRYFINQLQVVVFNDHRLSEYFRTACQEDIEKNKCGRLDDENEKLPHEQGAVIACLSQYYKTLAKDCRKEIFRLAEMQSDDYHLDRALYYACRDDRDRLCSQVNSGNGRVYRCLYEKKFDLTMSASCRKEIDRRQKLIVANAKLDAPLVRACKSEMVQHKCSVDSREEDQQLSLTKLLVCLEDNLKDGKHIEDGCRREMLVFRRMLMSDYALSPEIVAECKKEMTEHCSSLYPQGASGTIDQRGGRMIHCLLGAARKEKSFSSECLAAVKTLIRAVDPGNDIRADPLLETTCRTVIDSLCPKIRSGDSNMIMCLLNNLRSPRMTEDCEDRLMEVAYFMARDWRITPRLVRVCRENLVTFCGLPSNWAGSQDLKDFDVGKYLGCLYQKRPQLTTDCRTELRQLMQIRSQSINLMPEIEENCITDLATCRNTDVKGEEMNCLQKKYKRLENNCREAVKKYTQQSVNDPSLDFLLMKACEPMIQTFCTNVDNGNENDLIHCLIRHKYEQKMDQRCRAGIDHHQITSMKDEAFLSDKFRQACSSELIEHCQGKKTKAGVIQCLADLMLTDVLKKSNSINDRCRDELKFELLQRSSSIDFDPALAKACRFDVTRLCASTGRGQAQMLDCLKENQAKVSPECYAKLKARTKVDVISPENDYSLMSKCASVIQKYCATENKQNILSCLRRNYNQETMPTMCRRVLSHRLMMLNSDARLNKGLIENCGADIDKHCRQHVLGDDDKSDDDDADDNDESPKERNLDGNDDLEGAGETDREMGGELIQCLREKYADKSETLSSQCVTELVDVIQTSKIDVKLDLKLYQACRSYLDQRCTGIESEDCLKLMYQKDEIRDDQCREQIKRIIREGQADIHVDRALAFACQADIFKYCNDIPIGSGKQLQCLINMGKSVTSQCQAMLSKRQELWKSISNVDGIGRLTEEIKKSNNSIYIFTVIFLILCVMFMAGCLCRPYFRYKRVRKYK